jgi:hypothetical protein
MVEGIQHVRPVFDRFRHQVEDVLTHLA